MYVMSRHVPRLISWVPPRHYVVWEVGVVQLVEKRRIDDYYDVEGEGGIFRALLLDLALLLLTFGHDQGVLTWL